MEPVLERPFRISIILRERNEGARVRARRLELYRGLCGYHCTTERDRRHVPLPGRAALCTAAEVRQHSERVYQQLVAAQAEVRRRQGEARADIYLGGYIFGRIQ